MSHRERTSLDINLFRADKGANLEFMREAMRRRFKNPEIVDEIARLDKEWRESTRCLLFVSDATSGVQHSTSCKDNQRN